ncbi:MAG: citrate transporter [Clostridium sp.]
MPDAAVITPLHVLYLAGVISILAVMIMRLDTPLVCIFFLFLIGAVGLGSVVGGIQTVFNASLFAAREFMEIIATIALVTALSKCLGELGSDQLIAAPVKRVMKTPSAAWWTLGIFMFLVSLFLWPSPAVALVGAVLLPVTLKAGLSPLLAAMAMNLFGHGFALSWDAVIQGAPAVSASAAGISASLLLTEAGPVFLTMGIVTALAAFLLNKKEISGQSAATRKAGGILSGSRQESDQKEKQQSGKEPGEPSDRSRKPARDDGRLVPLAFLTIFSSCSPEFKRRLPALSPERQRLMPGVVLGFGRRSLKKVTSYLTDGFLFAIQIFAPVIVIGAFFFLGGNGITSILGEKFQTGILNDWAVWLASHAPLNAHMAAFLQIIIGGLTGLDGSGFSGLPLTGAMARTFGAATGASVPVLAALGQISAIYVGGGTIVPWGIIPVAAICGVSPVDLARKNLLPVAAGFLAAFLAACFLL